MEFDVVETKSAEPTEAICETETAIIGEKTNKGRRAVSWIFGFIFYATLLVTIVVVAYTYSGENGTPRDILGYSVMTVLSDSMQPVIPKDSVVLTKRTDENQINVGDNVSYLDENNNAITHRVIAIIEDYSESGMRGFQLQGVASPKPDSDIVYANNIIGQVIWHSVRFGQVMGFVQLNWMYIVIAGGLLMALMVTLRIFFRSERQKSPDKYCLSQNGK